MHNRGRLIVSNFVIKILHQDPFWKVWGGQEVFSRLLLDCCYANNVGNWIFALGPYDAGGYRFGKKGTLSGRIIDPRNFRKWDPHLEYVRRWIPELKDVPDKDVFNWYKAYEKHPNTYFAPMVDYEEAKKKWYSLSKK